MWGGASKTSLCFSGYKSINTNLTARLSVVYVTQFILQWDKDFYKYTPESLINSKPAIACSFNDICINSLLHFRLDFFLEDNVKRVAV